MASNGDRKVSHESHFSPKVSQPSQSVNCVYPHVVGLPKPEHFKLGMHKLDECHRAATLNHIQEYLKTQQSNFLGYQVNQNLDFSKEMAAYLDMHVNNIGDPFQTGNLTTNSKSMERAVLDYYAQLWNAKWPSDTKDPESYWGFCLTMGSTEANLYGMWNARDYLSGKVLIIDEQNKSRITFEQCTLSNISEYSAKCEKNAEENAFTPIAFYSEDTHYSFAKAMAMLQIKTFSQVGNEKYPGKCPINNGDWPEEVPSKDGVFGPGSIDIDALEKLVDFFASKGYPILVSFNYGTTFKGAYDDVKSAGERLLAILEKYGMKERELCLDPNDPTKVFKRNGYWFHVDGALGAAYMPFVEMAHEMGLVSYRGPEFDFRLEFVHSISMSGHKWPGNPVPCGAYMTKTKYQLNPPSRPEYIGAPDTTFAGSRNGLSIMLMWNRLSKLSYFDQINRVLHNEMMAKYMEYRLKKLEEELKKDLYVGRTKLALTVRFRQANNDIVRKYSLSNEVLSGMNKETGQSETRYYSHVFLMDHVTEDLINKLIEDLKDSNAFPDMTKEAEGIKPAKPSSAVACVPYGGRGFR